MASEINSNEIRASAFQSRLPISDCSLLVKCEDSMSVRSASKSDLISPTPTASNSQRVSVAATNNSIYNSNSSSNNNGNNSSNSPKMGSRRIFTPQFKLQVLESYRNDSDCKGNQRATARKYNIHRRQIQKWLQCESNLRSSVANINQNNVKHQFHNISHHQQQAPSVSRMQMQHTNSSASLSGATNGYGHHHPHHHAQALALNSLNVPSMPSRLASSNSSPAQGVLAAANLAAAVAVAIASTSSSSTSTASVSPLRPTAINGTASGVNNGVSKLTSSLLHSHHHHHHHFSMSPYTTHSTVAAPVPVTVPMLTHHIAAPPPQPHTLHQHYPYHNLPPHTHTHPLHLSHQPSAFLPTACLPRVLSAVAASKATDTLEKGAEENCNNDAKVKDESEATTLSATTMITTTTTAVPETITTSTNAVLTGSVQHGYIHDANDYECVYRNAAYVDGKNFSYQYTEQDCLGTSMTTPIDLSLGPRRNRQDSVSESAIETKNIALLANMDNADDNIKCHAHENNNNNSIRSSTTSTQVVDLTFRKRKVLTTSETQIDGATKHPQKLAKRLEENNANNFNNKEDEVTNSVTAYHNTDDEDEEIEIEVDVETKQLSSKPVKLFKPYLLDNDDDREQVTQNHQKTCNSSLDIGVQREPIIWSNHPAYDSSRASSLYSPSNEKRESFHGGSPYFHTNKPCSPQSVLSPTSATSFSPTNFLRCPKGSPVSGYESSSSICSERDETYSLTESRSYSVDIQMHHVCEKKLTSHPIQIHEWLDQETNVETNTPPLERASIALYA